MIKSTSKSKQAFQKNFSAYIMCLFIGIGSSLVAQMLLPFLIFLFFGIFIHIITISSSKVKFIDFHENDLIIQKTKTVHLPINGFEYQYVEYRSWKGLRFYSSNKEVIIWEFEFGSQNWIKILKTLKRLKKLNKIKFIKENLICYSDLPRDKF